MLGSRVFAIAALVWAGALAASSCSPPCSSADTDPVRVTERSPTSTDTVYESTPWDGTYLHFPGGRRYQLEHGLGVRPHVVVTYLAFYEKPLPGGNVAESAGNQAVIEVVDDEIIQVRNDTCAEFWLRVVAMTGDATASDAGASDAPAD